MSASPSGISEDIYVGSPKCKSLINISVTALRLFIVLSTTFNGDYLTDAAHKLFIKCCRKSDCLREHCCRACTCNAVKRLIPPVISRNSKSFDRGGIITKLAGLLFNGHFRYEFFGSFSCFCSIHSFTSNIYLIYTFPIICINIVLLFHILFLSFSAFFILKFA